MEPLVLEGEGCLEDMWDAMEFRIGKSELLTVLMERFEGKWEEDILPLGKIRLTIEWLNE